MLPGADIGVWGGVDEDPEKDQSIYKNFDMINMSSK